MPTNTRNNGVTLYDSAANQRRRGRPKGSRNRPKDGTVSRRWNETFIDAEHRNMNCYICGTTMFVPKKVQGSSEASKVKLRSEMIAHIKATHVGRDAAKLLKKFGADVMIDTAQHNAPVAQHSTPVDAEMVRSMVESILKNRSQENSFTVRLAHDKVPVSIKSFHKMLKETLRTIDADFNNIMLVGPAGSGKSTIGKQAAEALKLPYGFLSLSGGVTEGALLGRLTSDGRYLESAFVTIYENGGVFLLDEYDAADSNMLITLNAALANGEMAVPARTKKPIAKRHTNCYVLAAGNTWGTGADWQYVGRNQLDASTLSRFAGTVLEIGYDEALEARLTDKAPEWFEAFIKVRASANTNKVRRILGTRELLAGQKLLKAGYSESEAWSRLTAGWSADERRKAAIPFAA